MLQNYFLSSKIFQVPDAEPEIPEGQPKITARVMLLSSVKPEEPEDEKKKTPVPHLSKRIKFLVAKKANGVELSVKCHLLSNSQEGLCPLVAPGMQRRMVLIPKKIKL